MTHERLPPPRPAPDPLDDDEWLGLLGEPFAALWQQEAGRSRILRERVLDRVSRSARASRAFVTVRSKDAAIEPLAPGVSARTLYQASRRVLRRGEPSRVRLITLAPGSRWQPDTDLGLRGAWLVMSGMLDLDGLVLGARDFHLRPAGRPVAAITSPGGARVYLRESPGDASADGCTVHDASSGWDDFAPGIQRRVMWTHAGEAALLYHALPGAQVPRHGHGHDEECLMLDGELFLDDVLLRSGDYQLAPAGTVHGGVSTDTGVVLFAHGDLALDIRAD
ncbi:MAG: cupin domain-containing protein [Burkholderiales bacterium]|nr:cupin domain-containing protein [Burkholderiales bacterium]